MPLPTSLGMIPLRDTGIFTNPVPDSSGAKKYRMNSVDPVTGRTRFPVPDFVWYRINPVLLVLDEILYEVYQGISGS
jgi:hypothetical protein